MKDVKDKITVGVRLHGSPEKVRHSIEELTLDPEIELRPWRNDGGWPVPFEKIAGAKLLARYAALGRRMPRLGGTEGGEVVPHFHLGDEIVFLERDQFQALVGDVAKDLATTLANRVDFEKAVDIVGQFAIDTIPLPE